MNAENTCCFFGHRKIKMTNEMRTNLQSIIEKLIIEEEVDTFLFGNKSQFNDLCYQITSDLRLDYPHIKRIYVRAQFPYISDDYKSYLLQSYEETYYPCDMLKAGRLSYIKRNYEMINKSNFCIVYFDETYMPPILKKKNTDMADYNPKSGTKIAYEYALKKRKTIINIFSII